MYLACFITGGIVGALVMGAIIMKKMDSIVDECCDNYEETIKTMRDYIYTLESEKSTLSEMNSRMREYVVRSGGND